MAGYRIHVAAPAWTVVQALYAENGRVVAVGSEAEMRARARAPFSTLLLGDSVALPGLIDAHGHLEGLGQSIEQIDLRGVASYPALIARVVSRAAQLPPGTWIEGRGWDQNLWPDQQFPLHAELSRAVPNHPVLLSRVDGHAILVNAKALELAGLDAEQRDEFPVEGGRVLLDSLHKPTGVFIDNAGGLIERAVPTPDGPTRRRRLQLGARELVRNGLTGLHDMGEDAEGMRLLKALSTAGELPLEVEGYMSQDALETLGKQAAMPVEAGGELTYRWVGAKFYMDGALGSRGAALLAFGHPHA